MKDIIKPLTKKLRKALKIVQKHQKVIHAAKYKPVMGESFNFSPMAFGLQEMILSLKKHKPGKKEKPKKLHKYNRQEEPYIKIKDSHYTTQKDIARALRNIDWTQEGPKPRLKEITEAIENHKAPLSTAEYLQNKGLIEIVEILPKLRWTWVNSQ